MSRHPGRVARLARLTTALLLTLGAIATVVPPSVAGPPETFADDFDGPSHFDGDDGSLPWTTDWIESEADGPGAGAILTGIGPHCITNECMVVGKSGPDAASVEREANLFGAATATLTFDYKIHTHLSPAGTVELEVSGDGGGSWAPLRTYSLAADAGPLPESVDITTFAAVDTRIRFRLVGGTDDSHLNPDNLAITVTYAGTGTVVISEIDPVDGRFIELYNAGTAPVDIDAYSVQVDASSNVTVSQGGGPVMLMPGAHYLVTTASSSLSSMADQVKAGGLNNNIGLRLLDATATQLDEVGTGSAPWYEGTPLPQMANQPFAQSYERRSGNPYGNCVDTGDNLADFIHNWGRQNPQNLAAPAVPCGTPATANHVVISEFRPEGPAGPEDEFVEIFNPTSVAVDISGWKFHITQPGLFRDFHVVPGGTTLGPGAHYRVADNDGPTPADAHPYDVETDYAWTWGDVVLKDAADTIIDVFGYGADNGQLFEGTRSPSYTGGSDDRSFERRDGGYTDTDTNAYDFVFSFGASPSKPPNLPPSFDLTLPDRSDTEGDLISFGSPATDPDAADTLIYSSAGLPEGISIDPAAGDVTGELGPNSEGSYTVTVTVVDNGVPPLQAQNVFDWTVAAGEVMYLVSGLGGTGGGDDLLTGVDPGDLNAATNEIDIHTGIGTTSVSAAAMQPVTGTILATEGGQLGTIDVTTGRWTAIGPTGTGAGFAGPVSFDQIEGLAFDPVTGELYAVQYRNLVEDLLLQLDPVTGAHVDDAFGPGNDYVRIEKFSLFKVYVTGIAFHPATSELHAIGTDFASYSLAAIDRLTGDLESPVVATTPGLSGLSFDLSGQLWGVATVLGTDRLWRIDHATGTASDGRDLDNGDEYAALITETPDLDNLPPAFNQDLLDRSDAEGATVNLPSPATDPEGLSLSYSAANLPPGLTIDPSSGLISGTIGFSAAGSSPFSVDVAVADGYNGAVHDMFVWTVTDTNQSPSLDPVGDHSGGEGTPITFTATASDPDVPADILDFSLGGVVPAGASIDPASGVFTWVPLEAQGPGAFVFDVVVTDRGVPPLADSEEITVTVAEVNAAPVPDPIAGQIVDELSPLALTATAADGDLPVNSLDWTFVSGPGAVSPSGDYTWTPTEAEGPASYLVTLRVTDNGIPALSDIVAFDVGVGEVNLAPVVVSPSPQTHGEGDPTSLFIAASDADVPANGLIWSASGLPPGLSIAPASGEISGTIGLGAAAGSPYAVQVTVTDDGSPNRNGVVSFTWTVSNTNHSPVLDPVGSQTGPEGSPVSFTATASDPLDFPADNLAFTLVGAVPPGAAITPGGDFTWTPTEAQGPGAYTFDVVVTDDGVPPLSLSETITVTVTETNSAPSLDPIGAPSGPEMSPIAFTATAGDPDTPANTLAFSLSGAVPAGAAITAGGAFTWTPTETQGPGIYTFDVVVTDNGTPPLADFQTVSITVTEANVAPVLTAIGPQAGPEGSLLTFTASATDSDLPANGLSFSLSGTVPTGAAISGGGVLTWTPTETQGPGVYSFAVVVTDDGTPPLATSETVTFTIGEVNVAPVLAPIGPQVGPEGAPITFTATATDTDDPANGLTFSLSGAPAGATVTPAGAFSWMPAESQGPGVYTLDVIVTDDGTPPLSSSETVDFTISEVNTAPVLTSPGNQLDGESDPVWLFIAASDSDLPTNTLTWSAAGLPLGLSIDAGTGEILGTVSSIAAAFSPYAVTVTVADGGSPSLGDATAFQWTITDTNRSPKLDPVGDQAGDESTLITFTATGSDPDLPADGLAFSLAGAVPAGAAMDPNSGVFTWTPTEAQGPAVWTLDVVLGDDGTPPLATSETITVTVTEVNQPPALTPPALQPATEETPFSYTAAAIDPDQPGNGLTFSLGGLVPAGAAIDPVSGTITWTPTEADGPGSFTFDVTVTDDGTPALSDTEPITISVAEANRPPALDPIGPQTIDEGTTLTYTAAGSDPDDPANALSFSLAGAVPTGASITAGGAFTWTPTEAQGPGLYTFEVVLADDGAPSLTARAPMTITVGEVNAAPSLDPIGPQAGNELAPISFAATGSDPDDPANAVAFSLGGIVPAGASIDPVTGVFTWTPGEAQGPAAWEFDVIITDDGTPALSDTETITVTVNEVNTAPSLTPPGVRSATEEMPFSFAAEATDPDLAANALTFSLSGAVPAGAAIDPAAGILSWTPAEADGPGSFTFNITVTDDGAPALADTGPITIVVAEANRPPVLDPIGPHAIPEGTTLAFTASASDPDDPVNTLTFSLTGVVPTGAAIDPNSGVFTWTPSEAQGPGINSFVVAVTDDGAPVHSASETVTVTVTEVNGAPTLDPIGDQIGAELTLITFTAIGSDQDLPANDLSFSLAGAVPAGAAIDPATGVVTWIPTEAQGPAVYVFDVVLTDDGSPALSASGLVDVTVNEVNAAPTLDPVPPQALDEHETLTVTATAMDTDVPSNTVVFSLAAGAPAGAAIDPDGGTLAWTPGEEHGPGVHTIGVVATDDGTPALTARTEIEVTVGEVNVAPVVDPIDPIAVLIDEPVAFTATATDPDIPAGLITFSLAGAVPAGAAIDAAGGAFSWTPTAAHGTGVYTFDVVATDDGGPGLSGSATVEITVSAPTPAAQPPPAPPPTPVDPPEVIEPPPPLERPAPPPVRPAVDPPAEDVPTPQPPPAPDPAPPVAEPSPPPPGAQQAAARKQQIIAALAEVGNSPEGEAVPVQRTLVLMARAVTDTTTALATPLWMLLAALAVVATMGRIGLAPVIRRGKRIFGSLAWFDQERGYGYILADGTGAEAFVHASNAPRRQRRALIPGQRVSYRVVEGPNRDFAATVRLAKDA